MHNMNIQYIIYYMNQIPFTIINIINIVTIILLIYISGIIVDNLNYFIINYIIKCTICTVYNTLYMI